MVLHVTKYIDSSRWTFNVTSTYKSSDIIQTEDIFFPFTILDNHKQAKWESTLINFIENPHNANKKAE